jgi:hypothetical protein
VRHVSRSFGLLSLEASLARLFQSGLKTGGDTTADGAHGIITEVTLGSNQRCMSQCDWLRQILLYLLCHFLCIM